METAAQGHATQRTTEAIDLAQAAWYGTGALLGFAVPFIFSSILDLPSDLYYAIYFASVVAFLGAYAITTHLDVVRLFTRHWRWSLGLGVAASVFLVISVLSREDSTPHPDGVYFAFTILWRGVLYGVVDALLLSAFPVAVAYAVFSQRLDGIVRKAGFGVLALLLVVGITATYHLGYEQFRDEGVSAPETGNAVISVPALLTVNPLGSVVAHASMHVTADIHAYETDIFLPPQTEAE